MDSIYTLTRSKPKPGEPARSADYVGTDEAILTHTTQCDCERLKELNALLRDCKMIQAAWELNAEIDAIEAKLEANDGHCVCK